MERCFLYFNLNGYKIANPTVLARITPEELEWMFKGMGGLRMFVEGDDPATMHQLMAGVMEDCVKEIRAIQELPLARGGGVSCA